MFRALLIKRLLAQFKNHKTYNDPDYLAFITDKFGLIHQDLNVTWNKEIEQRRVMLKEMFTLNQDLDVDGEMTPVSRPTQQSEAEMVRWLHEELGISFKDKAKIDQLSLV